MLELPTWTGDAASGMIVNEIPFGGAEQYAAICLVGHILITYVWTLAAQVSVAHFYASNGTSMICKSCGCKCHPRLLLLQQGVEW